MEELTCPGHSDKVGTTPVLISPAIGLDAARPIGALPRQRLPSPEFPYPLGLLQLLGQLLHGLGVLLPHLLDLGLMGLGLILQGLLQDAHFLLTFRPGKKTHLEWRPSIPGH